MRPDFQNQPTVNGDSLGNENADQTQNPVQAPNSVEVANRKSQVEKSRMCQSRSPGSSKTLTTKDGNLKIEENSTAGHTKEATQDPPLTELMDLTRGLRPPKSLLAPPGRTALPASMPGSRWCVFIQLPHFDSVTVFLSFLG